MVTEGSLDEKFSHPQSLPLISVEYLKINDLRRVNTVQVSIHLQKQENSIVPTSGSKRQSSQASMFKTYKRTTSTGKHPQWRQDRDAPHKKAARDAIKTTDQNVWYIMLSSVRTCREEDFQDGQGLKTVWDSNAEGQRAAHKKCAMRLEGDPENLQIAIGLYPDAEEAFSMVLFEEEITKGGYASIGVMSFEFTQRLRITCHKTGADPKDTVWEVSFLLGSEEQVAFCKKSVRRLMGIVSKMPSNCIFYKNFVDRQVGEDGRLTVERDNGFNVEFSRFLGTPAGRRLVGRSLPDDPPAYMTRSGGASQKKASGKKQARAGDEDESEPTRPLTRRQKWANRKAQKEQRKQKRRAHVSSPPADGEEADKASKPSAVESESELRQIQAAEQASRIENRSSSPEADQGDSEEEFELESLDGVRIANKETQYLVKWSDKGGRSRPPTWQPENKVTPEAVGAFYRAQASVAAGPARRKPVTRGGRQAEPRRVLPSRRAKVARRGNQSG